MEKKGTWLGLSKKGRFAVLTNCRKKYQEPPLDKRSRGMSIELSTICRLLNSIFEHNLLNSISKAQFVIEQHSVCAHVPATGDLVAGFLSGDKPCFEYCQAIEAEREEYDGFNLIVGNLR